MLTTCSREPFRCRICDLPLDAAAAAAAADDDDLRLDFSELVDFERDDESTEAAAVPTVLAPSLCPATLDVLELRLLLSTASDVGVFARFDSELDAIDDLAFTSAPLDSVALDLIFESAELTNIPGPFNFKSSAAFCAFFALISLSFLSRVRRWSVVVSPDDNARGLSDVTDFLLSSVRKSMAAVTLPPLA